MIDNIWFKCVKLLPLSFDDCVTDYEVLCKLLNAVNKIIDDMNVVNIIINEVKTDMATLKQDFEDLKNYVNNYFDNLDLQAEVKAILEQMKESGELAELLTDYTSYTFTDFVPQYGISMRDELRAVNKSLLDTIKGKDNITICFVGDSITEGNDVYPDLLWVSKFVKKLITLGKTVTHYNYGLGSRSITNLGNPNFIANQSEGDTDTTFWRSWATEGKSWLDCVKATNADLYVLMFGYNDVLYNVGLSTAIFFTNMKYINTQLTNKTLWLSTPIGTNAASPELYDQRTRLRNGTATIINNYYCNSIDINRLFNVALLGRDPVSHTMTIYQNGGATNADIMDFKCGISFTNWPINKGDAYILARSLTMSEPGTEVKYTSCVWFDFYTNSDGAHIVELAFQEQGVKGAAVTSQTVAGNNVEISASGINFAINGVNFQSVGQCCWKGAFIPSNGMLGAVSLLNLYAFTDIILPSHVDPTTVYGVYPMIALYQGNGYSHPAPYGQDVIYSALLELIPYIC